MSLSKANLCYPPLPDPLCVWEKMTVEESAIYELSVVIIHILVNARKSKEQDSVKAVGFADGWLTKKMHDKNPRHNQAN